MPQELFIYWLVPAGCLADAATATQTWQQALAEQQPALRCGLYRRADAAGGPDTLMETYAAAGGIDDALLRTIASAGDAATAGFRDGARHLEIFEPLPRPARPT